MLIKPLGYVCDCAWIGSLGRFAEFIILCTIFKSSAVSCH